MFISIKHAYALTALLYLQITLAILTVSSPAVCVCVCVWCIELPSMNHRKIDSSAGNMSSKTLFVLTRAGFPNGNGFWTK